MESLFLLAVVFIIGIPLVAIVALVRVGGLRKLVDSQYNETVRTVSNLNQEIADLRNSLAKVSSQLDWQKTAARGSEATGPEASVRPAAVIVPPMEISMAQPAQTAIYIHPQPVEPVRSELTESASPDPEQFHASVNARALTVEFPSTSSTLSTESESAPEPAAHPAAVFSADIQSRCQQATLKLPLLSPKRRLRSRKTNSFVRPLIRSTRATSRCRLDLRTKVSPSACAMCCPSKKCSA